MAPSGSYARTTARPAMRRWRCARHGGELSSWPGKVAPGRSRFTDRDDSKGGYGLPSAPDRIAEGGRTARVQRESLRQISRLTASNRGEREAGRASPPLTHREYAP